ncbi:proprotein convertase P-domain-containing protein [Massilia sp. PAMC28688]|uniref:proprotein convertase P-domain-containing protein n=1 Tax=Massilia sp. PAMC28688 TaxID=2861283 RepID=UPI001C6330F7|nr:proprotein convertase P-domain-containing protein [Massilia sp. PAMC28688]QYF94035.1 proprotein convertase P-domain-containing protein [Massilia sp. PAMC28688]
MIHRLTLTALLLAAGVNAAQAAEPLFHPSTLHATPMAAPMAGAPFAGDRKVKQARLGLHMNPRAVAASAITLQLPGGGSLSANRVASYATASGSTVWVGKHGSAAPGSIEAAAEETVLVVRNGKVTGTVRHDGKLYRIRAGADGSHGVAEIDQAAFPPDHVEKEYRQQLNLGSERSHGETAPLPASTFTPMLLATPVVRVMVHYTPAARNTTSDMAALIDLAIAETNQGYINAGVNMRVELAHAAPVNYTESGSNSTDRSRYADVDDRVMDEIHGQRNTYGADVGVLMTEGNSGCGNGTIHASSTSAFVAVTADCATGNYSFGHELGHLFGARHNPEEDSSTSPYSYGHGYLSPNRDWRTIMAYNCSNGCPRINYWSNPAKTRNGVAMGTTTRSNNARVLNERAAVLAGFRATPATGTPVSVSNTGDYTIPDNLVAGVSSPVSVTSGGNAGTVTVTVNIIHPYIGDLVVDLIGPDNAVYNLHNRSGSSSDNIQRSYSVAVGAKPRVGTWKLRASDREARDTGHIESWTFKSQ